MAWLADPTSKLSKCSLTERDAITPRHVLASSAAAALGMDPKALLDYALFQLTPTRTRCDLVVFSGGISEKLASGLVEPFVHHLKFAKDQIPKGGYSITLQPPKTDAFWFTKATFERFVRFVSTPEVLERFAHLEKEISQIESSVQSSEFASSNVAGQAEEGSLSTADEISKQSINSSKLKGEGDGTDDASHEENSKIRLQRLLETRKGLLRKEQAMAYARALAAGFELDNIDDLIFFAEAFGASRLREACTDFKELCKKKHKDGLWMDELAAMEACSPSDLSFLGTSGIMLACESTPSCQNNMLNFQNNGVSGVKLALNGSLLDVSSADSTISQENSDSSKDNNVPTSDQVLSTDPRSQGQMPWPNQFPHYMFNFQNPVQQMPPYQAYPFPSFQPIPPYYPGNMHQPQNMDESGHGLTRETHRHRHQRSSSRKEKSPNAGPGTSEEDEQTESSDSDTGTDSDMIALQNRKQSPKEQPFKKRHVKKSSKTVVIRNINYITSNRRNEEKDEISFDSSSVEDELVDKDSLKQKVEDVVGSFEKHHKPTLNNKKGGSNKSSSFVNGSSGSADQDLENDPLADVSEGREGNKHWDAFQNLLLREKESTTDAIESRQPRDVLDEHFTIKSSIEIDTSANFRSVQFDSEKVQRRLNFETDSFVTTERSEVDEGRLYLEDFGNGESLRPSMKGSDCAKEALLLPQRSEESRSILEGTLSNGTESSLIKNGKAEDWFIVNHYGKSESQDITIEQAMFDGGYALSSEGDRSDKEKCKKIIPIDDSFMVQAQTSIDDQYDSHWKTDISMVSDIIVASQPENGIPDASQNKTGLSCEPDDLCVVLARDSGLESAAASWSPELDYGIETSFTESDKKNAVETNLVEEKIPTNSKSVNGKISAGTGPNNSAKQLRSKGLRESLTKSKSDVLVKSKKPLPTNRPMIQKSKLEKEEEARKRMEELVIQRQKRIAERTAASGLTPTVSKKAPVGSKGASPKDDKHRPQSTANLRKTNAKVTGAVNV